MNRSIRGLACEVLEDRLAPATLTGIRQAAGPSPASIQAAVDLFRAELGAENPNLPGSAGGGFRSINWDGVPDSLAAPNEFPGDYFNADAPGRARGVEFRTPGSGFQLSANAVNPTGTAPEFGNLNLTYPIAFQSFSSQRLFTPLASTVTDVLFFVPGTDTPATVRGFGAVFADVDTEGGAKLEFFDPAEARLHEQSVPPAAGNEGLSFVGVLFNSNAVARVRITGGTAPVGVADVTQGGLADVVVLDDFIYGEPIAAELAVPQGGRSVFPGRELAFSSATGSAITVTAGLVPAGLTLSVANGTLAVTPVEGVEVNGNGTGTLGLVGVPERLNDALDGLVYVSRGDFTGEDVLTVRAEGGFRTATVPIEVNRPSSDQNQVNVFAAGTALNDGRVRVFGRGGEVLSDFDAFGEDFADGVRVATARFGEDDVPDLAVGNGPGQITRFRVFDGKTGELRTEQGVYEPDFTGGIFLAAADLNGDGVAEIITSPDVGGGARIRVFDGKTFEIIADFFGIDDPEFRGGARVGVGDLNGDGFTDIIVGAGFGGGPRLAVFDGMRLLQTPAGEMPPKLFPDFFVFEQTLRNGVFVAAGDVTGDGADDLIVGAGPGGGPRVFGLDGRMLSQSEGKSQVQVLNFFAGNPEARQGVRVTLKDLDGDGRADLIVGTAAGPPTRVLVFDSTTIPIDAQPADPLQVVAFDEDYRGGAFVG